MHVNQYLICVLQVWLCNDLHKSVHCVCEYRFSLLNSLSHLLKKNVSFCMKQMNFLKIVADLERFAEGDDDSELDKDFKLGAEFRRVNVFRFRIAPPPSFVEFFS